MIRRLRSVIVACAACIMCLQVLTTMRGRRQVRRDVVLKYLYFFPNCDLFRLLSPPWAKRKEKELILLPLWRGAQTGSRTWSGSWRSRTRCCNSYSSSSSNRIPKVPKRGTAREGGSINAKISNR